MQREMQRKNLFRTSPTWVADAIVYEIFADRFNRSGRVVAQDSLFFQSWNDEPSRNGFHGGDLYGVIEGLDHLERMGINCIYFTPIFSSAANHRYHTFDYFQVDPLLGGNLALDMLISALHARGMKIVLDGVFNHCGRGFWAFHNLLENGKKSPYKDWFKVHQFPLSPYVKPGEDCGYSCWWNDPALPKFNHKNPIVRDYLISVAVYWLERGIDGWRLDVPDEVPLDFWVQFREKVKEINPEAWIVGEVWGDARKWLKEGYFDGVMNYRIGWSILSWVGGEKLNKGYLNPEYPLKEINADAFIDTIETTFSWYSKKVNNSQLNLLDSHDVPRALNTLGGDISALKIALCLLFLQPGAPCIYYGTEVGLSGGAEPACRECFPWGYDWDIDLCSYIRSLVELRKNIPLLSNGGIKWRALGENGLFGSLETGEGTNSEHKGPLLIYINRSKRSFIEVELLRDECLFLVGEVSMESKFLAPQSLVLLNGLP